MRREATIEDEDLPLGKQTAEVVIGAAIAKPELKHRSGQVSHEPGGLVEAGPLGEEAPDEAVESTHIRGRRPRRGAASDRQARWPAAATPPIASPGERAGDVIGP